MSLKTPYSDMDTSKNKPSDEIIINDYYHYILTAANDDAALEMIKKSYKDAIIEADDEIGKKKREAILKAKQEDIKSLDGMFQGVDKFLAKIFHLTKESEGFSQRIYKLLYALICAVSFILFAPAFFIGRLCKINRDVRGNPEVPQILVLAVLLGMTGLLFLLYYILFLVFAVSIVCKPSAALSLLEYSVASYGLGITMFFAVSELKAKNDPGTSMAFLSLIISMIALICTIMDKGGK